MALELRNYSVRPKFLAYTAAVLVAAAAGVAAGTDIKDAGLRPHLDNAVSAREDYAKRVEQALNLIRSAYKRAGDADKRTAEGLAREQQKDESLDVIMAKVKELGILPKE